ncbi:MAG: tRNA pseudouridine(13) synthase TruD, partial [Candidatus Diapherotrites archaeon]
VTIRNIDLEPKEIERRVNCCLDEIKNGIANYFGSQRFGGIRKISHFVGREIIKGNYEKAVMLYLCEASPQEREDVKEARLLASKNDLKGALDKFPKQYRYERILLHHLISNNNDYVGALRKLPKKITFLFTHAYQAYLFNKIISKRISAGIGLKPQENEPTEDGVALGLLPGYDSSFTPGIIGKIEREVLSEENIDFSMFKVKSLKECSSAGARRKIVMFPKNMTLISTEYDEFFNGKSRCTIKFDLEKGCYATIVLREIMKLEEVV